MSCWCGVLEGSAHEEFSHGVNVLYESGRSKMCCSWDSFWYVCSTVFPAAAAAFPPLFVSPSGALVLEDIPSCRAAAAQPRIGKGQNKLSV